MIKYSVVTMYGENGFDYELFDTYEEAYAVAEQQVQDKRHRLERADLLKEPQIHLVKENCDEDGEPIECLELIKVFEVYDPYFVYCLGNEAHTEGVLDEYSTLEDARDAIAEFEKEDRLFEQHVADTYEVRDKHGNTIK